MSVLTLPRHTPARHRAARRSVRAWLRDLARTVTVDNLVTGGMVGGLLAFGLVVAGGM